MFFETANIEIHPLIPPLVAFIISFFTSMGGVSGAFLLLPFQMSVLGFTSPAVSATNHLYNIAGIPGGVYRYWREGRMLFPLVLIVIIATLPGVFIGALVRIIYLPDPSDFKFFAGLVLLYIGVRLFVDILKKRNAKAGSAKQVGKLKSLSLNLEKIEFEFNEQNYSVSTPAIFTISFIVGIVGGIYGIGGGAIMAPIYVAIFKLPVYAVSGAALAGTLVSSIAGVIFFQILAVYFPHTPIAPDWLLGLLFGVGGLLGMYLGAKFQRFLPEKVIKIILAICILFVAGRYIVQFI